LIGIRYVVPLTFAVIALLVIVYFSYRQTIAAYPMGGGSYTVAKENRGEGAGLFAGAALMINYLLNVAVGISAGIGALVSAVPSLEPPIVLVPVDRFNAATEKALQFALTLSPDVQAVHVTCDSDEGEPPWKWAENPPPETPAPKLVTLPSPFRLVVHPIVDYVLKVERENPERTVAVVIASMVELHWYHYFLHNQRGQMLTALLLGGGGRINIINVPWHLKA